MIILRRIFFLTAYIAVIVLLPLLTNSVRAENNMPNHLNVGAKAATTSSPLQRLIFSARKGFLLRVVSNEEVTAEIRNGAGRILAHANFSLAAGDWKLHPKNLAPGLYTVLLRTGANLRSMRMKIEDVERGGGLPEWVLEKAPQDSMTNSALNSPPPITSP